MKVKKSLQRRNRPRRNAKSGGDSLRSFVLLTACALLAIIIAVSSRILGSGEHSQVYAAAESGAASASVSSESADAQRNYLPTGIAGVISGVGEAPEPGATVKRIGTSFEQVIVGERVKTVEPGVTEFNVSSSMESTVNDLDSKSITLAETPKLMSDNDYETLLRIVEAEAGGEDLKGRTLVANVIMNRVKHPEFPNTVTEVVWESTNGVPQFSPTYDGRIGEVTVSEETREAVKHALEGVDYSEGALFFIQKSAAEKHNVSWFEKDLKKLFKYGVHEFYTYPDDRSTKEEDTKKDSGSGEKKSGQHDSDIVQMVKNDILE